jgi:hypothetical protein
MEYRRVSRSLQPAWVPHASPGSIPPVQYLWRGHIRGSIRRCALIVASICLTMRLQKCVQCPSYDACTNCYYYIPEMHPVHSFIRVNVLEAAAYGTAPMSCAPSQFASCGVQAAPVRQSASYCGTLPPPVTQSASYCGTLAAPVRQNPCTRVCVPHSNPSFAPASPHGCKASASPSSCTCDMSASVSVSFV